MLFNGEFYSTHRFNLFGFYVVLLFCHSLHLYGTLLSRWLLQIYTKLRWWWRWGQIASVCCSNQLKIGIKSAKQKEDIANTIAQSNQYYHTARINISQMEQWHFLAFYRRWKLTSYGIHIHTHTLVMCFAVLN